MSDSFREVTSVSWLGRIKRSVGGLVIGLLLVVAMVILLFWNEGRAVVTAKSLAEGAGAVVSVGAETVDPGNDGKLVHVAGPVTASSVPADTAFGIARESVRLVRTVEMYQWKETSKSETKTKLGGGEETVTTYTYSKQWNDSAIDSGPFKRPGGHANPPMEISGQSFQIPEGRLGGFTLDGPVLDRIGGEKALPVSTEQIKAVEDALGGIRKVSVVDGRIYLGLNPTSPAIGDYRISYDYAPLGTISIVARQAGSLFEPYQTIAGNQLLMVRTGNVPAEEIFADAVSENTVITWILRLVGLLVMVIGFAMFLAPVGVVADVIPLLGSLMRLGTGLIAFLLAVLVGTTTIALAWFYYRPLLAVGILAFGLLVAAAVVFLGRSRGRAAAPAGAPSPAATPASAPASPAPTAPQRTSSKWS